MSEIKTRKQIIEEELIETANLITAMFVERDVMVLEKQDPLHKDVQDYNVQINSLKNREKFLKELLEEELGKNFPCAILIRSSKRNGFN
jgi:hypothetical protein